MGEQEPAKSNHWDIDAVVREVLQRLAAGANGSPTERKLSDRVVTVSSIQGQLEGVRTIVVPHRAVITPAASDLLRARKIVVQRSAATPAAAATGRALVLAVAETSYEPAALIERLARQGYAIEQLARTGMADVISELSEAAAKGGKAAVLLTGTSELALCLANRRRGVRAAIGTDRASVKRARQQIGVNVLIVNPDMTGGFQLQQILREFVEQLGDAPARWAALLEESTK
ncbi:MAG TPA: RpiB/LacA/LacB family sugar-phosphate isomerase [Pirellulales bacterium]|jgi:ribose 5-phosphate isomerase RpiB|nr:RpiB/LacA/LacB family sugar-phosphate isomerase [Pirellulales bacterium]